MVVELIVRIIYVFFLCLKHLMSVFSRNLKSMLIFTAGHRARGFPHRGDENGQLNCHWKILLTPSTRTQKCLGVVLEKQIVLEDDFTTVVFSGLI